MENAPLALLMRHHENYWTPFHRTSSTDAFWDKDECFCFLGVKGQGHSMTKGPADACESSQQALPLASEEGCSSSSAVCLGASRYNNTSRIVI